MLAAFGSLCGITRIAGSEWDYVILSTVRSTRKCERDAMKKSSRRPSWKRYLGVITDANQINVAITRASEGVVIVGLFVLVTSYFC